MKDAVLRARISARLLERLDGVLARKGLSRSEWLVSQVSKYVDEEENAMKERKHEPTIHDLQVAAFRDAILAWYDDTGDIEAAIEAASAMNDGHITADAARDAIAIARKIVAKQARGGSK